MTAPNGSPVHDRPPLSNLAKVHQHLPRRPLWLCRACSGPWPCPFARMLLRVEYDRNRASLAVYMAGQLFDATGDFLKLYPDTGPNPEQLWARFLAWTAVKPG
ncbi:hypothetical protein AB0C44_20315 [Micromonospora taraxaci]|uniref:hypothetical protein n=1 Tax=Micromonospora taraxaci TaxID=1316803 RepID=UPI0033CD633C